MSARPTRRLRLAAAGTVLAAGAGLFVSAPLAHSVAGTDAADGSYAYTAKLTIGADDTLRSCSGVLVAPQWILTATACFADPATPDTVAAGKPAPATTATVGRTDLTGTSGQTGTVVELVPHANRNVVLARLARPTTGLATVPLATTAPTTGEQLTATGYGRTATEWVPDRLHTTKLGVTGNYATTLTMSPSAAGTALCMGDTGGPLLREQNGTTQLAGINVRSWQGGCFGTAETETRTGAVSTRVDDLAAWVTSVTTAAAITDFNCDGVRDTAVADPDATVGGDAKAGLVRVVYGGGKGTVELNQDLDAVSGGAEAGDRFGAALATFDHDLDGCTDLAVGTPAEAIGDVAGAGMADILYGAPGGLTTGKAETHLEQGADIGALASMAPEANDQFGYALAAGHTLTGDPYLAVGAPGEDLSGFADAGAVIYLHGTGTTNVVVHQDSTGVPGSMEAGDKFGSAIAGSPGHLVVGAPAEAIGTLAGAGNVAIFTHTLNAENRPTPIAGMDQDLDSVEGGAEADDRFGASLALVPYKASATGAESLLAVGSPGEDGSDTTNAGRVDTFRVTATGYTQISGIYQNGGTVPGALEDNDAFGQTVSAMSTQPGAASTAQNTLLAVGVPGEDSTNATDGGTVYTFSLTDGAFISTVYPGKLGIPGTLGASQKVGSAIHATGTELYIGLPYGPVSYGSAVAVPWANILSGATQSVTTFQPGTGGLPAAGDTFGSVIR